jgi:addiction module RelE/StbE family toxin
MIKRTGQFKRDYKREEKGPHRATLDADFLPVLKLLANNQALPARYCDHPLSGDWKDHWIKGTLPFVVMRCCHTQTIRYSSSHHATR